MKRRIHLDLAGITSDGALERPLAEAERLIPRDVQLVKLTPRNPRRLGQLLRGVGKRAISWDKKGDRELWEVVEDDVGILDAFVQLADGEAEDILRFARNFGPLQLCRHGLPASHNPQRVPLTAGARWCDPVGLEPIYLWHQFAKEAKGLLNLAAACHRGKWGSPEDYKAVTGLAMKEELDPERILNVIEPRVDEWLWMGNVRPVFLLREEGQPPEIKLHATGAFGAVARQLAFAIARSEPLAICSGCGAPFSPSRKPRKDQRSWCTGCRDLSKPQRQAKRDQRSRLAACGGS